MGRHSRAMKMDSVMPQEAEPWIPEIESARSRRLGRHRTGLRVTEMRLKDETLEMDYVFNTGGASLSGTMFLPCDKDEELDTLVNQIERLAKESFHGVRRSRD